MSKQPGCIGNKLHKKLVKCKFNFGVMVKDFQNALHGHLPLQILPWDRAYSEKFKL